MKRLLCISDMHVGGKTGLCPPTVKCNGMSYDANKSQLELYDHWEEMVEDVGRVDAVLVNGDLCDGVDRKAQGRGMWTTDKGIQISTAVDLLRMIDTRRFLVTQGSGYHVEDNLSLDQLVADRLGATFGDSLKFKIGGKRMFARHHIGTSGNASYRSTPLAKEMFAAAVNQDVFGKFDVMFFGHAHYYFEVSSTHTRAFVLPCWKGRDSFIERRSLAYSPHCGYLLLEFDGGKYTWKHDVFELTERDENDLEL